MKVYSQRPSLPAEKSLEWLKQPAPSVSDEKSWELWIPDSGLSRGKTVVLSLSLAASIKACLLDHTIESSMAANITFYLLGHQTEKIHF